VKNPPPKHKTDRKKIDAIGLEKSFEKGSEEGFFRLNWVLSEK